VGVWEIDAAGIPCSCMNSFTTCPLLGLVKPHSLARCDQLTFSDGYQALGYLSNLSTAAVSRSRFLEPCLTSEQAGLDQVLAFLSGVTRPSILFSSSNFL